MQQNILTKEVILDFLRAEKEFLRSEFGVTQVALFGSYARDEQNEKSDIDLLISVETVSFENRMKIKHFLQDHFGLKVDIGYFDSLRSHVRHAIKEEVIHA